MFFPFGSCFIAQAQSDQVGFHHIEGGRQVIRHQVLALDDLLIKGAVDLNGSHHRDPHEVGCPKSHQEKEPQDEDAKTKTKAHAIHGTIIQSKGKKGGTPLIGPKIGWIGKYERSQNPHGGSFLDGAIALIPAIGKSAV